MLLTIGYIGIVLFLMGLAVFFRRTLKATESPRFVIEKPPMPKDLSATMVRIEKWREEGRLSREEYEKLFHLCQEDSGLPVIPGEDPSEN